MTEPKPDYYADGNIPGWLGEMTPTEQQSAAHIVHLYEQNRELVASVGQLRKITAELLRRIEALEGKVPLPVQRPAHEVTLTGIGEGPMTMTMPDWTVTQYDSVAEALEATKDEPGVVLFSGDRAIIT